MTPAEKTAFEIRIAHAEEDVKSAIGLTEITRPGKLVIEVEELKLLVYDSLKAIELLLEIANKSLDDSWDLKKQEGKMGFFKKSTNDQPTPDPPEPKPPEPDPEDLREQFKAVVRERLHKRYPELWYDEPPADDLDEDKFFKHYQGEQVPATRYSHIMYYASSDMLVQAPKYIKRLQKLISRLKTHQQELTDRLNQPLTDQEQKEYDKHTSQPPNPKSERAITEAENEHVDRQLTRPEYKLTQLTVHYQNYCNFVCRALFDHHKSELQPDHIKLLKHRLTKGVNTIDDFEQELNEILKNQPDQPAQPATPDFNLTLGERCPEPVASPLPESVIERHKQRREQNPWSYYVGRVTKDDKLGIRNPFLLDETTQKKLAWAMVFERKYQRLPNRVEWQEREAEPESTVLQSQPNRDRHTYIIGKSGSGKTTLMLNMIYQDLKAGNGLGVIAPEQEMLTEQILPYIPKDRLNDVIYFNPADENPVPFNPLNLEPGEDPHLKANEVMTIFQRVIGAESTPRIAQILYQCFYALITRPNTTLLDIRKLLNRDNPDFRQQIISQLQDEEAIEFWRDEYPQYPKEAHVPILYRVAPFTRDKRVRNTLCRTGQSLNFRQVMDTGKIVLFNLSDGILGETTSQLFGQLIVSQIQQAAISRANIPEQKRKRFYLYIDEFQTFTNTASASYEKILSRARKYKLALILAHQQTGQIPDELLRDIFGNVSTMVSFTVSHRDATRLSKEILTEQDGQLKPTPPEKFIELEVGETYCKLGRESFKMKTPLITEQPNWDIKEKILEHSHQLFTSDTPTRPADSKPKSPEPSPSDEPDKPLGKPQIKPTGRIG